MTHPQPIPDQDAAGTVDRPERWTSEDDEGDLTVDFVVPNLDFSSAALSTEVVANQDPEAVVPLDELGAPSPRRIPPPAISPYRFHLRQLWEGTVARVGEISFVAIIRDITDPGRPDEEAEFEKDEVSDGDLPLLAPGAVFRWSVGYRDRRGQKERVSHLSFQRLPAWSEKVVEEIERAASSLASEFPLPDQR